MLLIVGALAVIDAIAAITKPDTLPAVTLIVSGRARGIFCNIICIFFSQHIKSLFATSF